MRERHTQSCGVVGFRRQADTCAQRRGLTRSPAVPQRVERPHGLSLGSSSSALGAAEAALSPSRPGALTWREGRQCPCRTAAGDSPPHASARCCAWRRAIQFVPGVSVIPCRMMEQNTASAAMLKIRGAAGMCRPRISSENVIVATPLGPNHAMKAVAAVPSRVPARAMQMAIGRARNSVVATTAMATQPSANSPWIVRSEAKRTKTPTLTIRRFPGCLERNGGAGRAGESQARSQRRTPL